MKTSNEQLDDRIVEVHWDTVGEHWRMMRFRNDKPNAERTQRLFASLRDELEKRAPLRASAATVNGKQTTTTTDNQVAVSS